MHQPQSQRAIDDQRLLGLLKQAWLESGGVYGYRKLTLDMRDLGESCSRHRVARLLRCEGLKAQRGYRGRKKSLNSEQIAELKRRVAAGDQKTLVARDFGISRETLYQYLRED